MKYSDTGTSTHNKQAHTLTCTGIHPNFYLWASVDACMCLCLCSARAGPTHASEFGVTAFWDVLRYPHCHQALCTCCCEYVDVCTTDSVWCDHACVCAWLGVRVCACINICILMYTCIFVCACICMYIYIYTHPHIYTHAYTCIRIYIFTRTHTHILTLSYTAYSWGCLCKRENAWVRERVLIKITRCSCILTNSTHSPRTHRPQRN